MKINETKQIGKRKYNFQFEGKNLFEALMEAQKLSFGDITKCGICEKDNLVLNARIAQDFEYTEIKCLDCKASLTFGKPKKSPDTYYLRKNDDGNYDWKAYSQDEKGD